MHRTLSFSNLCKVASVSFMLAFLLTNFAHAQEVQKVFDAKSYKLENGLRIIVVENHRAPVVTHMIWYAAGAADEPAGKSGIAHFLEHLLFKGQKHEVLGNLAPGEFSKIIRSLGGEDNAFTSQDYTAYYQSIGSEHLETVMRMEAGRMRGVDIPEDEFKAEQKVIQEERRQRTDNDPRVKLGEQLREVLFPNHPYSIPVIGWMHEIETLTWMDAKEFYNKYYAPNNAVLVVSGDVSPDEVYEIAKRTYGIIEPADTPERIRTISPEFISQALVTLQHESIKQPAFTRTYRTPSLRQDKQDSLALEILAHIMGSGSNSRLYSSLVVEQKVATNISYSYDSSDWDDATLSIFASLAENKSIEDVRKAIDRELARVVNEGITDQELKDAITRMKDESVFARDSLSGPAMIIGHSIITGASLDDIEFWPQDIEKITKEQVVSAAKTYVNPSTPYKYPPVEGILLPMADKEKSNE